MQNIFDLEQLEQAQKFLDDPAQLVETYEKLTALECKRRIAHAAADSTEEGKLREAFEDVGMTLDTFEQILWGYIRDFLKLYQESPQTLVSALRVVMMDKEVVARRVNLLPRIEQGEGTKYRNMCNNQIQMGVADRFQNLLKKLVHQEDLHDILNEATVILDELSDVDKLVAPFFPATDSMLTLAVRFYTLHLVEMLQKLSDRAHIEAASPGHIKTKDILMLIKWLDAYEEKLLNQGVEEIVASLPAESDAMEPLLDTYVQRMSSRVNEFFANILEYDKRERLFGVLDVGPLYTSIPVDVFQLLEEEVDVVWKSANSLMLFKTATAIIQLLLKFQAQEMEFLKGAPEAFPLKYLCAMVNNNVRCHDLAVELGFSIVDKSDPGHAQKLDFSKATRGFLDVAKGTSRQVVECIFLEEGVQDLLTKLYKKAWLEGEVTGSLISTFKDFFDNDFKKWVEEGSFRKIAGICLERTVQVYVEHYQAQKHCVTEHMIARMRQDEEDMKTFFGESVSIAKLETLTRPLLEMHTLAALDVIT